MADPPGGGHKLRDVEVRGVDRIQATGELDEAARILVGEFVQ
jgi:hypothetical protein